MSSPNLIVGSPPALPGCCFICNSANDRKHFIDWSIQIEFHGAFYMCDKCVTEAAQLLGLITQKQASDLKDRNASLISQCDQLQQEVKALKGLRDGIDSVMDYLGDDGTSPTLAFDFSDSDSEDVGEGEGSLDPGEGRASESSDDEELGELRPSQLIKTKRSSS